MPVFLTQPLSRTQTTSQEFKDAGIQNAAPTPVGSVRLSIFTAICNPLLVLHYTLLWAFTAAFLKDKEVDYTQMTSCTDSSKAEKLFESPPVVVTFPSGRKNETLEKELAEISFTPQSSNRYLFYKGPANDTTVRKLVTLGGDTECYAPYGSCNIAGILTLSIINRLLFSSLGFLSQWTYGGTLEDITKTNSVSGTTWLPFRITRADQLPDKGIFFPYFDGLVLPDKAETPRIIVGLFSRCLGESPKQLRDSVSLINRGWPSLSTTATGLAISHLVFVMDLAVKGCCGLSPVIIEGEYKGAVLLGTRFGIVKDNEIFSPYSKETMAAELALINRHQANLVQLAELITSIKPTGETTLENVAPEHISSGRSLHEHLRNRTLTAEQQTTVRDLVQGLKFEEKFWEVTDRRRVATAIETILNKAWLPEDAPFHYKSGALFTKDPILSCCAAFGIKAPSILGVGNNAAIAITKTKKFYKDFRPASLRGTPIFAKPVQQAYEDWKTVMKTQTITFKHAGNDKMGKAKIIGMTMMVPDDSQEHDRITNALAGLIKQAEKRKREEEEDEESAAKKKKVNAGKIASVRDTGAGYLSLLGLTQEKDTADDDDMAWDD